MYKYLRNKNYEEAKNKVQDTQTQQYFKKRHHSTTIYSAATHQILGNCNKLFFLNLNDYVPQINLNKLHFFVHC
jgi:hypothetical protein